MRPIQVHADGHFFARADGQPFFWLADTAWQLLHRLDLAETERYLADRAGKGFTVIQTVAIGKIYGDGPDVANASGDRPFVAGNPLRPNEAYWTHVDAVIRLAASFGLTIALLPVWSLENVAGAPAKRLFSAADARAYGRWIGGRYGDAGVVWVLGGDCTPVWYSDVRPETGADGRTSLADPRPHDFRPVHDAFAEGILAADPDALLSYHPTDVSLDGTPPPRTSLYLGDRDWLHVNMLETGHSSFAGLTDADGGHHVDGALPGYHWTAGYNYLPVHAEYLSEPARPVIDGEPRYEQHPDGGSPGEWNAHHNRIDIYHATFAGAAGHTYGHVNVWDFHRREDRDGYFGGNDERADWISSLDAPGSRQMRFAAELLLSRPYFGRIPDDSIVRGDLGRGDAHISATRDRDGAFAMVYSPDGAPFAADTSAVTGDELRAWWFDPGDGSARPAEIVTAADPAMGFTPPSRGDGNDWVLVLDDAARSFPPPGSRLYT